MNATHDFVPFLSVSLLRMNSLNIEILPLFKLQIDHFKQIYHIIAKASNMICMKTFKKHFCQGDFHYKHINEIKLYI